jgi:hypothetical protein
MYKTKVFYTASRKGKEKFQKEYDLVKNHLMKLPIELVGTEVGNYKTLLTKSDLKKVKDDRGRHYLAIKKGIKWCDILVLELSEESFQIGHEATLALLQNKVVLGLSTKVDWSERIKHPNFFGYKYGVYTAREIINEFFDRHFKESLSERFNLFLSNTQLGKLDRISSELGMNKSEAIRKLIEEY